MDQAKLTPADASDRLVLPAPPHFLELASVDVTTPDRAGQWTSRLQSLLLEHTILCNKRNQ